jgi:DNA modification methylase
MHTITNHAPAELLPYARNSRTHSPQQIKQLVASIREFGFVNPVLIDADRRIIAGHGRVMAAKELGLPTVPCLEVTGLSEAQLRAYIIADNKLAENAGWDEELLRLELAELASLDFDLGLLGFNGDALDLIMGMSPGNCDPDDIPAPPEHPLSKHGDIYLLGKHRLMCGDSTDPVAVASLLAGGGAHLMVTDPPYGVNYDATWRNKDVNGKNGGNAVGKVLNDHTADWRDAYNLFPGDVAYVWHASLYADVVADGLRQCGFSLYSQIIWSKSQLVIGRGHYHSQHEPCWYAVRRGKNGHWSGSRKQATVWKNIGDQLRPDEKCFVRHDHDNVIAIPGDTSTLWEIPKPMKSETGHSTQKPVECMARPIRNNSMPGDGVYEPFSGSGTTIIAAEQTGRRCYAMELSPQYVDVAVKRWENFTGKKAELVRK